jgi:exopolyphosphatase/guanosine-5'-triphosphate,3'-diphosphate pyrophosphatase
VALVRSWCGVEIEVIPADEEARLAYLAAVAGVAGAGGAAAGGAAAGGAGAARGSLLVFDTGGGSSQFTFGTAAAPRERFSVEVGAARYTERFGLDGPVSPSTLGAARAAIAAHLGRLDGRPAPDAVVAMGGAVTNLAAVKLALAEYDGERVQGTVLDRAEIDRQVETYRTRSTDERSRIVGLQPARAAVILAGACIVATVLDKLHCDALRVSDRGLRHGVLAERFKLGPPQPFQAAASRYVSR